MKALIRPTPSCFSSKELQYSQNGFVAIPISIAETANTRMIAPIHVHDTLPRNTHNATLIVDNLVTKCQPKIFTKKRYKSVHTLDFAGRVISFSIKEAILIFSI